MPNTRSDDLLDDLRVAVKRVRLILEGEAGTLFVFEVAAVEEAVDNLACAIDDEEEKRKNPPARSVAG